MPTHRLPSRERKSPPRVRRNRRRPRPTRRGHFTFLDAGPGYVYGDGLPRPSYQATSVPGQIVFADTRANGYGAHAEVARTIAHVTAAAGRRAREIRHDRRRLLDQQRHARRRRRRWAAAASSIRPIPRSRPFRARTSFRTKRDTTRRSTSAAATTTKSATSSTAFRSTVRSITMRRARHRRSATPKSKSTPARTRPHSEGQGLAGFINQVIKTGTYPGYCDGLARHRNAGLLPSRRDRSRRLDARPALLVLHRHRRIRIRRSTTSTTTTAPSTTTGSVRRWASSAGRYGNSRMRPGLVALFRRHGEHVFSAGTRGQLRRTFVARSTRATSSPTSTSGFRTTTTRAATTSSCSTTTRR